MKTADISFYHLTTTPFERALPKILDKILSSEKRAVIFLEDSNKMAEMDSFLWSFSTKTLIPHGSECDEYPDEQPVYLTTKPENPNQADILIFSGLSEYNDFDKFNKILYFFDGNIENELLFARTKWQNLNDISKKLTYWKQEIDGTWKKI